MYQILSNHFGIQGESSGGFWSSSTSDQSFFEMHRKSVRFILLTCGVLTQFLLTHFFIFSFILSLSSVPIATANILHFLEKSCLFSFASFWSTITAHGTKSYSQVLRNFMFCVFNSLSHANLLFPSKKSFHTFTSNVTWLFI